MDTVYNGRKTVVALKPCNFTAENVSKKVQNVVTSVDSGRHHHFLWLSFLAFHLERTSLLPQVYYIIHHTHTHTHTHEHTQQWRQNQICQKQYTATALCKTSTTDSRFNKGTRIDHRGSTTDQRARTSPWSDSCACQDGHYHPWARDPFLQRLGRLSLSPSAPSVGW